MNIICLILPGKITGVGGGRGGGAGRAGKGGSVIIVICYYFDNIFSFFLFQNVTVCFDDNRITLTTTNVRSILQLLISRALKTTDISKLFFWEQKGYFEITLVCDGL